jgi:hypothetical protein
VDEAMDSILDLYALYTMKEVPEVLCDRVNCREVLDPTCCMFIW